MLANGLGLFGQLTALVLITGTLTGVSYLPSCWEIPNATSNWLQVLWQVQATSVGLVLTLVVFVFGLLQGRGRLTYREFLRRTWALPLTVFNVASLLFNGLVLLGVGRRAAAVKGVADGHGWAVSVASVVSMMAIGSIVVILARARSAIDPATEAEVQRRYRDFAVSVVARDELIERESLQTLSEIWFEDPSATPDFSERPDFSAPPDADRRRVVYGPSARDGRVVRDVSLWRLQVLSRLASRKGLMRPVVHVWPGKIIDPGAPLVTVDGSSGPLGPWWARRCVRLGAVPPRPLDVALTVLRDEVREHSQAGRAADAAAVMRELGSLQELVWQTYAAYGPAWEPNSDWRLPRNAGERMSAALEDMLQEAAVSDNETARNEASALPREIAGKAQAAGVPEAVRLSLRHLESVYGAIVGQLSGNGQHEIPDSGLAQNRLLNPFASLLSHTDRLPLPRSDIRRASEARRAKFSNLIIPPISNQDQWAACFQVSPEIAEEVTLEMLERAVRLRDSATVGAVLGALDPDVPPYESAKFVVLGELRKRVRAAWAGHDAMMLRLLAVALQAESAERTPVPAGAVTESGDGDTGGALLTDLILACLSPKILWDALDRALKATISDDRELDESISEALSSTAKWRLFQPISELFSPLMQAFAVAAIARPELWQGAEPSPQLALGSGQTLIRAVIRVRTEQVPRLLRHGSTTESVAAEADKLTSKLERAIGRAMSSYAKRLRAAGLDPRLVERVGDVAADHFRYLDTTAALFDWAQQLEVRRTGLEAVQCSATVPRIRYIDTDDDTADADDRGDDDGTRLASMLADEAMERFLQKAREDAPVHDVRDYPAVTNDVRNAIKSLTKQSAAPSGQPAPATKIAVLIPKNLREASRLVTKPTPSQIRCLRITDEFLASKVIGFVDGAVVFNVFEVGAPAQGHDEITVIDLARFGKLYRDAKPGRPKLSVPELGPPDPTLGTPAGSSGQHGASRRSGELELEITLSVVQDIDVDDPRAVRILKVTRRPRPTDLGILARPHA